MNDDFRPGTVEAVQTLYEEDPNAKKMFDWTATLRRDATMTTIDTISRELGISRKASVALARELEDAGCGEFIVGRRGSSSRFKWAHSRVSLGRVAAGETEEIEDVSDPIPEEEEMSLEETSQPLTIRRAKTLLAEALGVEPGQVEIKICA